MTPPVVTLLTDFGTYDSYVAEMKAAVLRATPTAQLIDITHDLEPGDIRAAQYVLARSWQRFPTGAIHLVVVDPGVGTPRRALAAESGGHLFVAPDNGVLTPVLPEASIVELSVPGDASPTFHGRDVFAPAAGRLAAGTALEQLGSAVGDPIVLPAPSAAREGRRVVGAVVYVDRFGNLITNIPGDWCGRGRVAVQGQAIDVVRRTFGDVDPGAPVAYVGSAGTLEIGVRDGSAKDDLHAGIGAVVSVDS